MPEPLSLLYIADGLTISVFDSQVLHLLKAMKASGVKVHLAIVEAFAWKTPAAIMHKLAEVRREFPDCLHLPGLPLLGRFTTAIDFYRLRRLIRSHWDLPANTVVHCRGHFSGYGALQICDRRKLIVDLRGLVSEEIKHYSMSGIRGLAKNYRIAEVMAMERFIARHARKISVVSQAFRRYLCRRYSQVAAKTFVVPTVVATDVFAYDPELRAQIRRDLGIEDRLAFIYTGSLAGWQLPRETIRLFAAIRQRLPSAFLLFLTPHPKLAAPYLRQLARKDYYLAAVDYRRVAHYLNAADIGLLLRHNNLVNQVAAPTKFSEYLCCGLPVILTKNIGDSETIVTRLRSGLVIDAAVMPDCQAVIAMQQQNRSELARAAQQLYGIETNVKILRQQYNAL